MLECPTLHVNGPRPRGSAASRLMFAQVARLGCLSPAPASAPALPMMIPDPPDRSPQTPNEWGLLVILSFFFGLMLVLELAREFRVEKLSVPAFLLSWVLLLVLHEFGHALMARALGWRVEGIAIGIGRVRWAGRCLGMPVEVRTLPLAGFALPRPVTLGFPRLKHFLIYAAGPGVELLAVALLALLIGPEQLLSPSAHPALIAAQSFCVAALFGAGFNLIPLSHASGGGQAWSDGLGMINCWRLRDEDYRRLRDKGEDARPPGRHIPPVQSRPFPT